MSHWGFWRLLEHDFCTPEVVAVAKQNVVKLLQGEVVNDVKVFIAC